MFQFLQDFLLFNEKEPMIFTQAIFWGFFLFVMAIFSLIYKRIFWRNFFLLIVSLFFYYKSGGWFFGLLIFSTVVDYVIGNMIYASDNKSKRYWLIITSLVINLGLLVYFKYTYFFTDIFNQTFSTNIKVIDYLASCSNNIFGTKLPIDKIILPVGISFYTFQTLSYSIDIYRNELKPVKNIWDFAFFVSFFPQLVAGPIVRASEFVPQIYEPYRLTEKEYGQAIFLILNGLIKKILISDYISTNFVDRVFNSPSSFSGFENLMAVYGYAIQIYCDFSGYSDMAIGLSLLLGFKLSVNFNSPYTSVSITDFWRRWHISLSSWLRDYLYISLGGNRHGKARQYINLFLTMFLGGLWHGASIRFIIWGSLHGLALALHKVWLEYVLKNPKDNPTGFRRFLGQIFTFHFVAFCWIFFRADNMDIVYKILWQIGMAFNPQVAGQVLVGYYQVFLVMFVGYLGHILPKYWKDEIAIRFGGMPDLIKALIIFAVGFLLFQVRVADIQPFIYFQF